MKRILVVVMLIFMVFVQNAGGLTESFENTTDHTLPSESAPPQENTPSSVPALPTDTAPPIEQAPSASPVPPSGTASPAEPADSGEQHNDESALPGPLVDHLPPFDPDSPDFILFKEDMDKILEKALKQSGIKSLYGLFIMDLARGYYYGVNENLTNIDTDENVPEGAFNSASVIKLFQGYIFCDMIRRGELDPEKIYYDKVTGRKFKLIPMIKTMISRSDNNYSNACLRIVDNKKSNEVLRRLGITNSRLYGELSPAIGYSRKNNIIKYGTAKSCARITPMDTGLILYNIYKNKYTDPYMKALNEALLGNIYNTRIPVGVSRVSKKYFVAHKTGTSSQMGVYNDAGIVYTEKPFILVVFTKGTTSSIGHTFIRSLAEQLTRYFGK